MGVPNRTIIYVLALLEFLARGQFPTIWFDKD